MKTKAAIAGTASPPRTRWHRARRDPGRDDGRRGKTITHTLKLDDIDEGFEPMMHGESIRSVVVF
jgi:hypothetical protein